MFQPLHNLVTVVLDPKDEKTKGGIVLPDNFDGVFLTGVIRSAGPGRQVQTIEREPTEEKNVYKVTTQVQNERPAVAPGDRVMIAQHRDPRTGRVMPYPSILDEDVLCIICDASEVMGIIERVKN